MTLDQSLRRLDDVAGLRNPIEVRENQTATGNEHAPRLCRGSSAVEPMPALTGANHVEAGVAKRQLLGETLDVTNRAPHSSVERASLIEQRRRTVETYHVASSQCETSGERSGSGPEIEHAVLGADRLRREDAVKKRLGETGAMTPVVAGGLTEIDVH